MSLLLASGAVNLHVSGSIVAASSTSANVTAELKCFGSILATSTVSGIASSTSKCQGSISAASSTFATPRISLFVSGLIQATSTCTGEAEVVTPTPPPPPPVDLGGASYVGSIRREKNRVVYRFDSKTPKSIPKTRKTTLRDATKSSHPHAKHGIGMVGDPVSESLNFNSVVLAGGAIDLDPVQDLSVKALDSPPEMPYRDQNQDEEAVAVLMSLYF